MYLQAKDFEPDEHAPETSSQERDVEEGGRRKPEQDRRQRIKGEEDAGVADQIAGDGGVPCGVAEGVAVEDGRLGTVDEHGPEAKLADDFEEWTSADEDFFDDVGQAVEGRCRDGEEVAFQLIGGVAADVIALNVV